MLADTREITRGASRNYVDFLDGFSGDTVKFEDWELATTATLGQTVSLPLLNKPATLVDLVMIAWDKELCNFFLTAFMKGPNIYIIIDVKAMVGYDA